MHCKEGQVGGMLKIAQKMSCAPSNKASLNGTNCFVRAYFRSALRIEYFLFVILCHILVQAGISHLKIVDHRFKLTFYVTNMSTLNKPLGVGPHGIHP